MRRIAANMLRKPSAGYMRTNQIQTQFSYACTRCGQCCTDKTIQVNPYEVARLAHNKSLTIPEFRDAYTRDGVTLNHRADGACALFDARGCSVHPDRPLVCRLFPLGRRVKADGSAHFSHEDWSPPPNGVFGIEGTITDYVEQQGAQPFIDAADGYFAWYCRALDHVERDTPTAHSDLLDLDAAIEIHCAHTGEVPPVTWVARLALHLQILDHHLTQEELRYDA